ncbi:MAG: hypothetical protein IK990_11250 [Ruminiclostridium sp.]|nr:hypothetical protein [Ruminiclostridium sp.]
MARRKRGTPEQQARRELISELLSAANVQSMDDIQNLFKETIAEDRLYSIYRNCRDPVPV